MRAVLMAYSWVASKADKKEVNWVVLMARTKAVRWDNLKAVQRVDLLGLEQMFVQRKLS